MEECDLRDEAELESIIRRDSSKLEPGLSIITDQKKMSSGRRLDLLAVDIDGILTLIELKVVKDEGQLQQALNYYDWVLESIDFIREAYKHILLEHKKEIKDEMPRIILVAPDFDKEMLTAAKFIRDDIDLKLLRYRSFTSEGRKEIVPFPIDTPELKEIEEKPKSINDFLGYIGDTSVGKTFKHAIEIFSKLSDEGPVIRRKSYKFRYGGRKFAEIYIKHGSFWVGLKGEYHRFWKDVKTLEDITSIKEQIKLAVELVGGKFKEELFS